MSNIENEDNMYDCSYLSNNNEINEYIDKSYDELINVIYIYI